jgi:PQQ-like domain
MTDTPTQSPEPQGWREAERRRILRTRRTLVAVLVVLVILLLIASYALLQIFQPVGRVASVKEAEGLTWVRSIYGWGKTTDEQFWGPQGVAIGPDGIIWATTQGQNRVVGFNPDGTFSAMLYQGPQGDPKYPNSLNYPVAVAVDPSGLIYIADQTRSRVWVMTRDNRIVRSIFVPAPASLAVSNDRLVVGSASGFVIMTPTGQVIKVLGTLGKGIDQFEGVRGVAIGADGTIYAVDQYNNRVSAYDRQGKRKWIVATGSPGNQKPVSSSMSPTGTKEPANMQVPAGLAVDGANRLVVVDPFGFDLTVLNPKDGSLIAKYGAAGTLDGQFVYPSDVFYDPTRDWFAVTDTGNARVEIVRLPNSGATRASAVSRALAGPLRACIIPLLLIFLAIVAGIVYRVLSRRRKKKSEKASPTAQQADGEGEIAS